MLDATLFKSRIPGSLRRRGGVVMPRFVIEVRHTKTECLRALHELLAQGPDRLESFMWGCMAGEHTSWAAVDADSEEAARRLVPSFLRNRSRVINVGKFTAEQVRSLHLRAEVRHAGAAAHAPHPEPTPVAPRAGTMRAAVAAARAAATLRARGRAPARAAQPLSAAPRPAR
jgi:hypothetical protein